MTMTGSGFAFVGKLARLARGLAGIPARASKPIAARLSERLRDEFTGEHDPYGHPWAPLKPSTVKRKRGNSVILYRSGETQAQVYARPLAGAGVALVAGGAAGWHQQAHGSRQARPVLPDRGLPPTWRDDIAAVLGAEFARSLGRSVR